ncbi:P-loop NTPase [Actinoplanes xinjiangensis]|uniref:P-loop NTPase n=1 Tax=Actinoplanes xinjiangensis TaxID=512350 RepID=UPI00341EEFCD
MDASGSARQAPAPLPIIAVASGKGGVGKSSVAVAIGRQLVGRGRRVGLVDADIAGPDVPRMLGLRRDVPARSITLARWGRAGQGGSGPGGHGGGRPQGRLCGLPDGRPSGARTRLGSG